MADAPTLSHHCSYVLHEEGVPHEHDTWICQCGRWWYEGGCTVCGDPPEPEDSGCDECQPVGGLCTCTCHALVS
jgi:hypothetical protein